MKKSLRENVGWYGAIAIVLAYALANFGVISVHSFSYTLLNLTGSAGIITEALPKKDYQSILINIVWIAVAALALAKLLITP